MGVQERLSFESANAHSLLGIEHRHRYEFAARACDGLRVLDLCCGVGYGSAILAERAESVLGVDNDAGAVDAARATAEHATKLSFAVSDAADHLRRAEPADVDLIVCFEGLEHVGNLEDVIVQLERLVAGGVGLIASVPNSTAFKEDNEFHVSDFTFEAAVELFARFEGAVLAYQSHAEGSFIRTEASDELTTHLSYADVEELEYANNVLVLAGEAAQRLAGVDAGMQLAVAPISQRYVNNIERSLRELHFANARLAREKMGHGDAAAGSILARERDKRKLAEEERDALQWELAELRRHFDIAHPYALLHDTLVAERTDLEVERAQLTREREVLNAEWHAFNQLRAHPTIRIAQRLTGR